MFDAPPSEPLGILRAWLKAAGLRQVPEPGAMALATADERGHASNRMVHLLEVTERALIFTSHASSQKGREIALTQWASGVLYWHDTKQQIILSGPTNCVTGDVSDALWARRSPATYAMSIASHQSAPLGSEDALRALARQLGETPDALRRPDGWVGYALQPVAIEFWQASSDRLHRRLRYDATDGGWTHRRLQP
ncbi:pyridoxal 5'-phosphate synthase [Dyella sp. GSA-30]|uniref:pyridoxal 5'-phosphate synthase n=1 Tax=Dyella sp. GSA-30 TaxID=2994496 RepID=UPI00249213A4|nr:pyridoxal 5'-phosphate synthase [Dyella sp. GSA-30]